MNTRTTQSSAGKSAYYNLRFLAPSAISPPMSLAKKQRFGFLFEIRGIALDFEIGRFFLDFDGNGATFPFEPADTTSSSMELGMIMYN